MPKFDSPEFTKAFMEDQKGATAAEYYQALAEAEHTHLSQWMVDAAIKADRKGIATTRLQRSEMVRKGLARRALSNIVDSGPHTTHKLEHRGGVRGWPIVEATRPATYKMRTREVDSMTLTGIALVPEIEEDAVTGDKKVVGAALVRYGIGVGGVLRSLVEYRADTDGVSRLLDAGHPIDLHDPVTASAVADGLAKFESANHLDE